MPIADGGGIQAGDFPFIARRGFDHVRIPIRFSGHALAAAPNTIDATFFSRVDTVLSQAVAANLAVVVDMHAYDDLAADATGQRDRFAALWKQIAARYQSRPDTVAFELFNEPNGQLDATWNGPPATPINPVQAAKEAAWASQWFMDYNTKPAASNPSGPATITAQIALITACRQSQGRAVYNGEWGPQDGGALDSRARLVTAVRRQCESAGVGWAIWEDPVDMNLFDSSAGTWLSALIDALLPP